MEQQVASHEWQKIWRHVRHYIHPRADGSKRAENQLEGPSAGYGSGSKGMGQGIPGFEGMAEIGSGVQRLTLTPGSFAAERIFDPNEYHVARVWL